VAIMTTKSKAAERRQGVPRTGRPEGSLVAENRTSFIRIDHNRVSLQNVNFFAL
jgi:hypothetical protein